MSGYMKTYMGRKIDPLSPNINDILIEDIAHALSLNCRGNGQVTHFYSVAQHCINAAKEAEARGYSEKLILACLLHDGAEAYLTDLIRPVKQYMPKYIEIEDNFLALIYEKFGVGTLSSEEAVLVKAVDNALLEYDLALLLGEDEPKDGYKCERMPDLEYKEFKEVEEEYLLYARKYIKTKFEN